MTILFPFLREALRVSEGCPPSLPYFSRPAPQLLVWPRPCGARPCLRCWCFLLWPGSLLFTRRLWRRRALSHSPRLEGTPENSVAPTDLCPVFTTVVTFPCNCREGRSLPPCCKPSENKGIKAAAALLIPASLDPTRPSAALPLRPAATRLASQPSAQRGARLQRALLPCARPHHTGVARYAGACKKHSGIFTRKALKPGSCTPTPEAVLALLESGPHASWLNGLWSFSR